MNIETILSLFGDPDLPKVASLVQEHPQAQVAAPLGRVLQARVDYNLVADAVAAKREEMSRAQTYAAEKIQNIERQLEAAKAEHANLTESLNALRADVVAVEIVAKSSVTPEDVEAVAKLVNDYRAVRSSIIGR